MKAISNFEPWLKQNRLEFFPEYTDHGLEHFEAVLASASSLITDAAWEILRPADAAALTIATLLHDCGMHLTANGFQTLLDPSWEHPITNSRDIPWPDLWEQFVSESLRFDGKTLARLFGSPKPARRPPESIDDWTDSDRMLIGEFLRRHHPRLAHEIACFGVPGFGSHRLTLGLNDPINADLYGLIARSHGMPIRNAIDWIRRSKRDAYRDYRGIFAPYSMALLRIADYLQVGSERAPTQALLLRSLRSPVSVREWNINQAIESITNTTDDPEAIFVTATPHNVEAFLRLQSLFSDLQRELDDTWAALGETYGRGTHQRLDELELVLRRVRSNLDDIDDFERSVSYVPRRAAFSAADAELLKLLVSPLYGDDPSMGIRELMQNAVDAVRERKEYSAHHGDPDPATAGTPDVSISVEKDADGKEWLICRDQGIGMTFGVIRDFFLRAGASFRRSDAWRKEFETPDGHALILRSGRFGIGALAAFLLGDEVVVSTRHINESRNKGIRFSATIDTDAINTSYCERPIGTEIRVLLSSKAAKSLQPESSFTLDNLKPSYFNDWCWYCLNDIHVERRHHLLQSPLSQEYSIPSQHQDLPVEWRRIRISGYGDFQWTYRSYKHSVPELCCNGIQIKNPDDSATELKAFEAHPYIRFQAPAMSIFDADGILPLNLQRTGFNTKKLPFDEAMATDLIKDFIAWLLVALPTRDIAQDGAGDSFENKYAGIASVRYQREQWLPLVYSKDGVTLFDASLIGDLKLDRLLPITRNDCGFNLETLDRHSGLIRSEYFGSIDSWFRDVLLASGIYFNARGHAAHQIAGARILMHKDDAQALIKPKRLAKQVRDEISESAFNDDWVCIEYGTPTRPREDFYAVLNNNPKTRDKNNSLAGMIGEWSVKLVPADDKTSSFIAKTWRSIVGATIIPFDKEARRTILSHASSELASCISSHQRMLDAKLAAKKATP